MKAGDLRHRIELQKGTETTTREGRRCTTWTTVATIMAGKKDVSTRDLYAAMAEHAVDVVTFVIRYRRDIKQETAHLWRVVHDGTAYEIIQPNALGYRGDYMLLQCRAVEGKGA